MKKGQYPATTHFSFLEWAKERIIELLQNSNSKNKEKFFLFAKVFFLSSFLVNYTNIIIINKYTKTWREYTVAFSMCFFFFCFGFFFPVLSNFFVFCLFLNFVYFPFFLVFPHICFPFFFLFFPRLSSSFVFYFFLCVFFQIYLCRFFLILNWLRI